MKAIYLNENIRSGRMRRVHIILSFLLVLTIIDCKFDFDNPVDPKAESYQGFPTVGSADEISLIGPATGSVVTPGSKITFVISEVIGAPAYQLQISLSDTSFESSIIHDAEYTSNTVNFPEYTGWGGVFYWRSRAKNTGGTWGAWSVVWKYGITTSDGTLSAWTTTSSFSTARTYHTSIAYNDYVYVIGGYNSGNYYSDVQYAKIDSNGNLGSWTTTTSLSAQRYSHASTVYNGYIYVLGGYSGGYRNDVQYIKINSNGSLENWNTTSSFSTARYNHSSVAYNGYLYIIGGGNNSGTYYNDVQFVKINADGSVGTWAATTSFSTARFSHTSVVYNGFLYVIGGYSGSYKNDVQFAKINEDGSLGNWLTTNSFSTARSNHTSVVYDGYVYVIGGYSGEYRNDVQYAKINSDGSLGSWAGTSSFSAARFTHKSVVLNGYVFVIGGDSGISRNDVQYAKVNSSSNENATIDRLPAPIITPEVYKASISLTVAPG